MGEIKKNRFARGFLITTTPILRTVYHVKYVGRENVPAGGGFIMASNHLLSLDPFYIALGCKKELHFMAKYELFKKTVSAAFFRALNAFPVRRGFFDRGALRHAVSVVKNGGILGIFPEGARSIEDRKPHDARPGVAYIAHKCECDVVPVSIYNSKESKPFTRLTVRYGKPIPYKDLRLEGNPGREEYCAAADLIMKRIKEMWEKGHA